MHADDELTVFPAPPTDEPRRAWVPPDFEDLPTAPEVTAYAGTWT